MMPEKAHREAGQLKSAEQVASHGWPLRRFAL